MVDRDRYRGCFLGLAAGDALGARYEGGVLERALWKVVGRTAGGKLRYTDDTQMAMDIAVSVLRCGEVNQDDLARQFARSYRWSRGYGPSAAVLLRKIRAGTPWQDVNRAKFPTGSYGNGAAMRAPIIALLHPHADNELEKDVIRASEITHAHPNAIAGAQLIAAVTQAFLKDCSAQQIVEMLKAGHWGDAFAAKIVCVEELLQMPSMASPREIRRRLGNGMAALDSCATAVFYALRFQPQPANGMFSHIAKLGGDVDTIGAMAGAIWGASNGVEQLLMYEEKIEAADDIVQLADKMHALQSLEL